MCQDVDLKGDITIGAGTVVHPKATILALGPIVIGQNCIIEESVIIVNRWVFYHWASPGMTPAQTKRNHAYWR